MKSYTSILFLALCLTVTTAHAQTPFDSFAPETSRPMLGLDAITARENLSPSNVINNPLATTDSSADDISKWLSVDPLADKYPNISPYAYCSWNPMRFVDPDGRADIEIQWKPEEKYFKLTRIEENKEYDQVHIIDDNGKRIASSEKYTNNTIKKAKWGEYKGNKNCTFRVIGDENAASLFEFLGANFTKEKGLPLEWSRVQIGTEASEKNIIGTSMDPKSTNVGAYLLSTGYTIRGVYHNHPSGNGQPSDNDLKVARSYNKAFPQAPLYIFTPECYTIYDRNGVVGSFLPELIVTHTLKQ